MSQSCFREIWGEPPQFSMGLLGVVEGDVGGWDSQGAE